MEGSELADEDKDYEVVDKRKVRLNEQGEPEITKEATEDDKWKTDSSTVTGSGVTQEEPQVQRVDADSLIKSFIGILSAHAWQWLGLVKNPLTGQIEKDLSQAKIAIDTMATLIISIEPRLQSAEKTELQAVLSDLRMNFVKQSTQI